MTTVEAQSGSGVIGSILLLDDRGERLLHGAAPSLPADYNAAIDGIAIGPTVGSCGTAAFTAKPVVVSDLETDPLGANFKDLALRHGLRDCWSMPIFSSQARVLVIIERDLHSRKRTTAEAELTAATARQIDRIAAMFAPAPAPAAIAVMRGPHHVFEVANRSYGALVGERSLLGKTVREGLPELAGQGFFELLDGVYRSGQEYVRWYEYTGTSFEQMQGWAWEQVHDPVLLPKVIERWQHSLATGDPFEMEFTLRGADGVARWFLTRVVAARDASGTIIRWFGTNTNIDAIKSTFALTQAVAEQSRDAQRMLLDMRADKERAEQRVAELEAEKRALGNGR